jgi:LAGLIDADG DNA endonuclease family protein
VDGALGQELKVTRRDQIGAAEVASRPVPEEPFGHWLAGFVDGEGCFNIKKHVRGFYGCSFSIALRADDAAILERIRRYIGLGGICRVSAQSKKHPNPSVQFAIGNKFGCRRVADVFHVHSLRAKKLEDFDRWSEAVDEWFKVRLSNQTTGRRSYPRLEELMRSLKSGRSFRERDGIEAPAIENRDNFGHWLAGFTDGEGCFMIRTNRRQGGRGEWFDCRYAITLRADDLPILKRIQQFVGCGSIMREKRPARPGANLRASYHVCHREDCQKVVEVFTRYPLRAKKSRDFACWTEAVAEINKRPSQEKLRELFHQMTALRVYQDPAQ